MSVNGFDDSKNKKEVYTKEEVKQLLLGTTLYENEEGTTKTITLNESVEDYNYLEIYYVRKGSDGIEYEYSSKKIYNPNGKSVSLINGFIGETVSETGELLFQVSAKVINITGNIITVKSDGYVNIISNAIQNVESYPCTYITKVVGYK